MRTDNEVFVYCMNAQSRSTWLRDYCNKLCTDVVVMVNKPTSTFEPITLPGDMLWFEENDIGFFPSTDVNNLVMYKNMKVDLSK